MQQKRCWMIIDGQWGSTGKGLIAGYLARKFKPQGAVCNFGPNAGHTFRYEGRTVMTRQLPTAIVSPDVKVILIGPGAIIDPEVLDKEMVEFADLLKDKNVFIHERAAVTTRFHRELEQEALAHISSTGKGTGAAMCQKIMRGAESNIARDYKDKGYKWSDRVCGHDMFMSVLLSLDTMQIESAQGFELGINSGSHYPYCTGRDVTPAQVMADCSIPHVYFNFLTTFCSLRTFPIRVGDQYDAEGKKVGTSGPVYQDQEEITFEKLGVPDERTTVTGKIRRIFTFSNYGTRRMFQSVRPGYIFLNFVNYLTKSPGFFDPAVSAFIMNLHKQYMLATGVRPNQDFVRYIGCGPDEKDVLDAMDVRLKI
ncbi:MAG: hypothetical protein C4534_06065 [Gaiellales bacterium]|nr:MAG: hypothetical protein C4534_06065 [Gaiellales bacterium]